MALDRRLLDILCCPVSKVPVRIASTTELETLNQAIASGQALDVAGNTLTAPVAEALITTDQRVIYRIDDGIPVMLADEGIGTTQFSHFPR